MPDSQRLIDYSRNYKDTSQQHMSFHKWLMLNEDLKDEKYRNCGECSFFEGLCDHCYWELQGRYDYYKSQEQKKIVSNIITISKFWTLAQEVA